jgi:hypothetical protein
MKVKDVLKMLVGIPPGGKTLARHGEVPIPGEAAIQLPAGEVKLTYAESISPPKDDQGRITFSAPQDLRVTITPPAGGDALEVERLGLRSAGKYPGPVTYASFGSVTIPTAGSYRVAAEGSHPDAVEPRLQLG